MFSVGFKLTTFCICYNRLTARPWKSNGRERTPPRLILKHFKSILRKYFVESILFRVFCKEILLRCFNINIDVVCSIPWDPRSLAVIWCSECRRSWVRIPLEKKNCFSQFTPFYEVECEYCFVKLILKYKNFEKFKTQMLNYIKPHLRKISVRKIINLKNYFIVPICFHMVELCLRPWMQNILKPLN